MKIRNALAVLLAACVLGLGLGLAAHAVTTDTTARPPSSGTTPSATAVSSLSPRTSSTPSGTLSSANLLTDADLKAAGFVPAKGQSTWGEGDLQYALTPCIKQQLGSVTSGNVFSGNAYNADGRLVGEVISVAYNKPQAQAAAKKLVGWHQGRCSGGFTSTALKDGPVGGGHAWTFAITKPGTTTQYAVVLADGDRLAVLGIDKINGVNASKITELASERLGK